MKEKILYPEERDFSDIYFNVLMQKRIKNVLLLTTKYDAFVLEDDGRIDEQIFNEYVSLNLRYPPVFIQASSANEAYDILQYGDIDLIIIMLSVGNTDAFDLAKRIKTEYKNIPIVVLTHFSRDLLLKMNKGDLSIIDYIFCWLGNADLLVAIIKLIEDKMNVDNDVKKGHVQTILLVEDSIRYYSSYLPNIYKILFTQSKRFMSEGLNEHQKNLRMRGRPKILMATTYDEAINIYEKHKDNLLGIISDISYKRNGVEDKQAGIKLCKKIRSEQENMPYILQSSDIENKEIAKKLGVGFINKYSKTLSIEVRNYMIKYFAFGDFIFRNPDNHEEIGRASDLKTLQNKLSKISNETLVYHVKQNDFSKWLYARALFPLADVFKPVEISDFTDADNLREYMIDAIQKFRKSKSRGVIAKFDKNRFDEYVIFSRIGDGSIGGKARGLAFVDLLVKKYDLVDKHKNVTVTIPRTVVLCADVFDEFMEINNLYNIGLSSKDDTEVFKYFINAKLPGWLHQDLYAYISIIKRPIAVRSSSKLEDSHYQPFAGIYSTYMIPYNSNKQQMIRMLSDAIKSVYASVYFKSSKAYMAATANVIDEEKMGIILQEVCGNQYGDRYYPTFSGVARSVNFYPIEPEKSEDGIANIALGLGKYIVDGGMSLRFSPKYPKKILQLSTPEMALRNTQKYFYALDMKPENVKFTVDDAENLLKLRIKDAEKDGAIDKISSTYDLQDNILRDGTIYSGKKIITFSNVLNYNIFPLDKILQELLYIGQNEMNNPVEIEFAVNLEPCDGQNAVFNILQIRPIVDNKEIIDVDFETIDKSQSIIYSEKALGNGEIEDIYDFVYVKPESFNPAKNPEIAIIIDKINSEFITKGKNYILVGPGRWGSSDPWLGIPVNWTQISAARVIIESGLPNYQIDPSQGTHFFQNLTSFNVGYFTINPFLKDGIYDLDFLNKQQTVYEDDFIKHIRFKNFMPIIIDGKNNKGIIMKPKD